VFCGTRRVVFVILFLMRRFIQAFLIFLTLGALVGLSDAAGQKTPRQPESQSSAAVEKLLLQIGEALQKSDAAAARALLQKALKIAPRSPDVHTFAGVLADGEGDYRTAEKHFALAVKLAPVSASARNNYGAVLLRLKRPQEAAREFEASLRANPSQPSALVNLAQIRFAENDLPKARELFEKAKTIQPSDAEILRALVVISLRLKETERARRDFQEYFPKAGETKPASRAELGALLLESGLADEALKELEAAHALDASDLNLTILLARAYLRQKNVKAAGRLLESVVARGVEDARIYAALADVYQTGGYLENAIPAMRLAVETEPKNEFYRVRYGMLLVDAKAPPAAVIRLKEAVGEFPNSAKIWLGLGIAQYYDSKLTDARQSLEKSLRLDSRLVPAIAYLAFISNVEGDSQSAAAQFERALTIEPDNAVLHYLLADTLLKISTSEIEKIEKHLRRAIALDANLGGAHLGLGKIYVRQKRFAEAAAAFEKTIKLEPDRTEAYYQLGQIYARLKRVDESRAALAKFKELSEREKTQTKNEYADLLRRLANVNF
jgi:Tfp pilus assembly protein PilF